MRLIFRAAGTVAAALALIAGGSTVAQADTVAPVRRISCPSVAAVKKFVPTAAKLSSTITDCDYSDKDGGFAANFKSHLDGSTPAGWKEKWFAELKAAYVPVDLIYIKPVPALGEGAFIWADASPLQVVWQVGPGHVGQVGGPFGTSEADMIGLARLFRPMMEVYAVPGTRTVNGRDWRTTCENYSATARCRTDIWATQITRNAAGVYKRTDGWVFNSLTYRWSDRALWKGNPLAGGGKVGGSASWTSSEGRKWRTECDTAVTGRGACRSYIWATVHSQTRSGFVTKNTWVFNNQVLFEK